ncbi:MAG: CRISPR-associated endonuclease Cas3'' [Rhodobacteraceae bacterium]|nr:CRISPR-associated endonuclease Cas3'' [Paracoccaceae bacterium]MCY4326075.1 CRISPR-associated endonuclease Cas3'' [Paracoccaceae bacterium]
MIFAHSVKGDQSRKTWETLEDHSVRVATAVEARAESFGCGQLARTLGLLHDLGKSKSMFQRKLLVDNKIEVSHSGEGAKALLAWDRRARFLAGAITGHHGCLPNRDRLERRLATAEAIQLPHWCNLPSFSLPERFGAQSELSAFRLQFLTRMLYGALCDADDHETAAFYTRVEGFPVARCPQHIRPEMALAFDRYTAKFSREGSVNALRSEVLQFGRGQASEAPGLFTLTVPTGGGKTLTSLGFGLDHALLYQLRRLIFVIPYTSIIEQTADVFRAVLGDDAVLEHHSAADWEGEDETEAEQRRIAGASWDSPVIVTTAVQFFESLFSAHKKRCRKLPSLAKSLIVLDEAQTLPLNLLRPCLAALQELISGYGASVVLCTATQPALTKAGGFLASEALEGAREIAPDSPKLFAALKRVKVYNVGLLNDAQLSERVIREEQVLVIVDNRIQARRLYDSIRGAMGAAHLSTLMTPGHRRAVLKQVRNRLAGRKPVRLISTSLIEAGVDVDFPLVLRAASGIDSIAQAAGRCNREGNLIGLGRVEIFRTESDAPPAVEQFAAIGRGVLRDCPDDPIGETAVALYFRRLWQTYGNEALDSAMVGSSGIKGILKAIKKSGINCPYEDIEAAFRLIEKGQCALIVLDGMWGVGAEYMDELRYASVAMVAKRVQPHIVNVPWKMWHELQDEGHISWWVPERFDKQFAVLINSDLYDTEAGLSMSSETGCVI